MWSTSVGGQLDRFHCIIITNSNPSEFKKDTNNIFIKINWFKRNLLSLNFDKTHFLQLITKNSQETDMQIVYEYKQINNTYSTKYLRLIIDSFCLGKSILLN
jgi:hypothetical protein